MKQIFKSGLILCMCLVLAQCGASKKVANQPASPSGVEISIPLSGPEYQNDQANYRAVQQGVSPSESMAKKIAIQNARQEIAANIQADLSIVVENYGSNREVNTDGMPIAEMQSKYQELANTVVSQMLTDVGINAEKLYKLDNGNYRYHVCIQIKKKSLEEKLIKSISEDQKLQQDFNIEEFRKVFEAKMKDFQKRK